MEQVLYVKRKEMGQGKGKKRNENEYSTIGNPVCRRHNFHTGI
jgi:hypothetical protein